VNFFWVNHPPLPIVHNSMRILLAFVLVCIVPAVAFPDGTEPVPRTIVALEDGSLFPADTTRERILLKTPYGEQRIPLKDIRSLRRVGEMEFAVQTPLLSVTGDLGQPHFELDTKLGRLRIPSGDLKSMTTGIGLSALADSSTAALWSFADAPGGICYDVVRQRRMTLHEMEIVTDKEGLTAAVRRSEGAYAEAPTDPDLEFVGTDFTLEARVKMGTTTRSYSSIVWKCEAGRCDYGFLLQPNGSLYAGANSNQTSSSVATPPGIIKPSEWSYVAMVVEAKTRSVTFYVNGKPVHHLAGQYQSVSTGTSPFTVGAPPSIGGSFAAPESIQFIRVSKVARKPEDIREFGSLLDSARNLSGGAMGAGVHLRDGGFLRAKIPDISGATFKTSWGELKLPEGFGGQMSVYRYRPKALPAVQERAREEVRRLGSGAITEREEAVGRLVDLAEVAVPYLKEAANDSDPEVRSRAEALLKRLETAGVSSRPATDVLRWGESVIHGWLQLDALDIVTRYGTLKGPLEQLESLGLGPPTSGGRRLFRLKSGERIQADPPAGVVLVLETSFGELSVPLREVMSLVQDEDKKVWNVRTDRLTVTGKLAPLDLKFETPAGILAVPAGEILEVANPSASSNP
jgi:hypothetical protein